jgi:hypothetical protein
MIQYGIQRNMAAQAVDLFKAGTLKVPGNVATGFPSGQITDGTANSLPPSRDVIVQASGGTFQGSAFFKSDALNLGAIYSISSTAGGAVNEIKVIDNGGTVNNVGATGETIEFNAETLNAAFGVTTITGSIIVATVANDYKTPLDSSGNYTRTDHEAFAVYGSAAGNAAYDLKVELISSPVGDFVIMPSLEAHSFVPLLCRKVYVTDVSTTATSLIALI